MGKATSGLRAPSLFNPRRWPAATAREHGAGFRFKAEGFSQGVAGSEQAFVALTPQQITERVPSQFEGVLRCLDQTLLLPLVQRRRLKKTLQLLQCSCVIHKALLPANVSCQIIGAPDLRVSRSFEKPSPLVAPLRLRVDGIRHSGFKNWRLDGK